MSNEFLAAVFDELIKHDSAKNFVRYLLSDLLDTRFTINSIARENPSKVVKLVQLIWDELYLCDPESTDGTSCSCGKCFDDQIDLLDELLSEKKQTASSAKCRAIPPHVVFFCQNLHGLIAEKFPENADSVVADFLFDRWIMKEVCEDGNKNGLIATQPITGAL